MNTKMIDLFANTLAITINEQGNGRPYLLLHGGAGTKSMAGLADVISKNARAIAPTHPGFDGQPRPEWFHTIDDLVLAYLALIESLDLQDVVLIGNSVGGWIAAELALRASPRISALVMINSVGLDPVDGEVITDPLKLEPADRASYAFHDPATFGQSLLTTGGFSAMAVNQQNLLIYAGEPFMHDQDLRFRLDKITIPSLILWGESDRIVTPAYGRQFAEIIPNSEFQIISKAGHFPQIEQVDVVINLLNDFLN